MNAVRSYIRYTYTHTHTLNSSCLTIHSYSQPVIQNEPTSSIIEIWFNSHLNNFSSLPSSHISSCIFSSLGFFLSIFFLSLFYGITVLLLSLCVCVSFLVVVFLSNIFFCLLFFILFFLVARMMLGSLTSIHFKSFKKNSFLCVCVYIYSCDCCYYYCFCFCCCRWQLFLLNWFIAVVCVRSPTQIIIYIKYFIIIHFLQKIFIFYFFLFFILRKPRWDANTKTCISFLGFFSLPLLFHFGFTI